MKNVMDCICISIRSISLFFIPLIHFHFFHHQK